MSARSFTPSRMDIATLQSILTESAIRSSLIGVPGGYRRSGGRASRVQRHLTSDQRQADIHGKRQGFLNRFSLGQRGLDPAYPGGIVLVRQQGQLRSTMFL